MVTSDLPQWLLADELYSVRGHVAANPNTPPDVLRELSDGDVNTCLALAKNPSTPEDVLRKLAKDENDYVRRRVVDNPTTPIDVLAKLAHDANYCVRWRVAQNSMTPTEVLKVLAEDKDDYVRRAANEAMSERLGDNPSDRADAAKQVAASQGDSSDTARSIYR